MDSFGDNIISNLRKIYADLNNESFKQYLDMPSNATTSRAWASLKNYIASLDEIQAEKNSGLFFAGLMGHFSSGKSSLINVLMGLRPEDNAPHKREAGENPVDKAITFITARRNMQKLHTRNFLNVDGLVIVPVDVAILFLDNIVLFDTPGAGENAYQQNLVLQFMRCDSPAAHSNK